MLIGMSCTLFQDKNIRVLISGHGMERPSIFLTVSRQCYHQCDRVRQIFAAVYILMQCCVSDAPANRSRRTCRGREVLR